MARAPLPRPGRAGLGDRWKRRSPTSAPPPIPAAARRRGARGRERAVPRVAPRGAAGSGAGPPLADRAAAAAAAFRSGPRRELRGSEAPDRLEARDEGHPHPDAVVLAGSLLPSRAVACPTRRVSSGGPRLSEAAGAEIGAPGRLEADRPRPGGDRGALPRILRIHLRRSRHGALGDSRAGSRDLSVRPLVRAAAAAPRGIRRGRGEERRSCRVRRGAGPLRADRGWLQHLLRVPGWRVGVDLLEGASDAEPDPRGHVVLDRSLAAGSRESGGDRLGRVLVLPQARLPTHRNRARPPPRARGEEDRRISGLPLVARDPPPAGHRKPPVRDESVARLGPLPRPQHRFGRPEADADAIPR